jgi:hypothetical protein
VPDQVLRCLGAGLARIVETNSAASFLRLLTGWSLVRIQPGEPNLSFCQIWPVAGRSLCAIHLPIELVHVHGVHAALKPVVFGSQPSNGCFVLPLFIGVAGAKRVVDPSKDFLIESQSAKQFREPLTDDSSRTYSFGGWPLYRGSTAQCEERP